MMCGVTRGFTYLSVESIIETRSTHWADPDRLTLSYVRLTSFAYMGQAASYIHVL